MSLVLSGSTSGSVTLQEPAIAGTTVLDLPAVSGTILTTTSPKAGNVIQVVSSVFSSSATTTNSSFTASGMSASITPTSSSSKVFIVVAIAGSQTTSNGAGIFTIYRGATNIGNASDGFTYIYSNATFGNPLRMPTNMAFLDSPATTSSTTYEVYFKTNTVGTVGINNQSTNSTITLMEIAA